VSEDRQLDLADPFVAYLMAVDGPVDVATVDLDTPLLTQMRRAGATLVVPMVAHGDLVGVLSLGPRRDGRPYDHDDHRLLERLTGQAAPALRLAQIMRDQAAEVQERERISQELRVARLIQEQFLPTGVPDMPGWRIGAYYRPAREVGGDFYDFIQLPDGRVGVVIGDVTDKGVPAALVMATTQGLLREIAHQAVEPAEVLARVNTRLVGDIPPNMFVTCQYAVFDPATGRLTMANAGHNLPYLRCGDVVTEVRATGMPLGLMAGSTYEQLDLTVERGSCLLLHSDGLAEARSVDGELFGFPRVRELVAERDGGEALIDGLLTELNDFVANPAAIDDDVTLVTIERDPAPASPATEQGDRGADDRASGRSRVLEDFSVASVIGNERDARLRVARAVDSLGLDQPKIERVKTAVAEAVMNAMEHGNRFEPSRSVDVRVLASDEAVTVEIYDEGADVELNASVVPDIDAKLAGQQSPRGWGLFLIEQMVDQMSIDTVGDRRRITLEVER
jgi:serine phosphatase RsbU (regulator of sigma subunit)/anti-sigma regulatory factor (Ser/Thr protein kinase)